MPVQVKRRNYSVLSDFFCTICLASLETYQLFVCERCTTTKYYGYCTKKRFFNDEGTECTQYLWY